MESSNLPVSMGSLGSSIKNTFLTKKEKFWGNLSLAGAGVVGLIVLTKVLPWISNILDLMIGIVGKGIVLAVGLGVLGILVFMLLHPSFHEWLWFKRAILYRKLAQHMVKADPIGTIWAFINEYLEVKLAALKDAIERIFESKSKVVSAAGNLKEKFDDAIDQAAELKNRSYRNGQWVNQQDQMAFRLASTNAGMYKKSIEKAESKLNMIEKLLEVHTQIKRGLEFRVKAFKSMAETMAIDLEVAEQTSAAVQIGNETLSDSGYKTQIVTMAIDYVRNRVAESMGQVENLTRLTPELLGESELQGDIFSRKMLVQLDGMKQSADEFVLAAETEQKQLTGGNMPQVLELVTSDRKREEIPAGIRPRKYTINK
jgi:hypothetical protein